MNALKYLYSFGRLRHIQDPDYALGTPFCDHSPPPRFQTGRERLDWHKGWSRLDKTNPDALMAADMSLPVCKRCEKAWRRRQEQTS